MSIRPKEIPEYHHWKLGPEASISLFVSGGLTQQRLATLRKYLDLLEPAPPVEGPHESDYPEREETP